MDDDHLDAVFEDRLANMTGDEFDALLLRVRPPQESSDPKERAAAALRRERGSERRGKATKQNAADALRRFANNS